jgi:hypothetical protein
VRIFRLNRLRDDTGISGTGIIAEGVQFSDGRCVLRFITAHRSIAIYDSMADLQAIHGHGGKTVIRYCGYVNNPMIETLLCKAGVCPDCGNAEMCMHDGEGSLWCPKCNESRITEERAYGD